MLMPPVQEEGDRERVCRKDDKPRHAVESDERPVSDTWRVGEVPSQDTRASPRIGLRKEDL